MPSAIDSDALETVLRGRAHICQLRHAAERTSNPARRDELLAEAAHLSGLVAELAHRIHMDD
jgi:hypothetical protein